MTYHTRLTINEQLQMLGDTIRLKRKRLKVSATAAAESAGVSRVTWHRIEKGEPSVSAGAYFSALTTLGLIAKVEDSVATSETPEHDFSESLPLNIKLTDFPQLKSLAWQVHDVDVLSPKEVWGIYQRNWRYLEQSELLPHERLLIKALQRVYEEI